MPVIISERMRLRSAEREDIPNFLKWINDPEVVEFLEQFAAYNRDMEEAWFDNMLKGPAIEHARVIEIRQDGEWIPIGNISFMKYHQFNRSAEIGIMIGEKDQWNKGYGTEAMRLMCDYGFNSLNLHRIFLRVFEGNERGKQAYKKAGFIHEGTMRQAHFRDGRYWDVDLMSIIKTDKKD